MLDEDYSAHYAQLIRSVDWGIELPMDWDDYFDQRGEVPSYPSDERNHKRIIVRTHGVMWFTQSLPFQPRSSEPVGIYTRDFSRKGIGLLSPVQVYPEEILRVVLPTFWVDLRVTRGRRITSKCYEVGAVLLRQSEPSMEAFDFEASAVC